MRLKPVIFLCAALVLAGVASAEMRGNLRLTNSPFLGGMTHNSVIVWARASDEIPVQVKYREKVTAGQWLMSEAITAKKADEFVVQIPLKNLKPDTVYEYDLLTNGLASYYTRSTEDPTFKTFPAPGTKGKFKIGFGSCSKVQADRSQPIWNTVWAKRPDVFMWVGDNIYGDTLQPTVLAELYRMQRDVPEQEKVNVHIPQFATWDDHDFGLNDWDQRHPEKNSALSRFKRYWANLGYGEPGNPGVYSKFSLGDVDVFLLDGRFHRDPNSTPNSPAKTMLGKKQLAWLKAGLKESKGTFKLLAVGTPWNDLKGTLGDSWAGFKNELNDLLGYIKDEKITGVVLMSGDTHVAELIVLPWANRGGYDFYELVSSPLGRETTGATLFRMGGVKRLRPVYDGDRNFGLIEIDTTATPPTLSYNAYNTKGEAVWATTFTVTADELKNGVSSWQAKVTK